MQVTGRYAEVLEWLRVNRGRPEVAQPFDSQDVLRFPPNWITILVGGRALAGKDEVANHIFHQIEESRKQDAEFHCTPVRDCWANELKADVQRMFGFTNDQIWTQEGKKQVHPKWGFTSRAAQQKHGQAMRELNPRVWVTRLEDKHLANNPCRRATDGGKSEVPVVIISDGRYINEAAPVFNHPRGLVLHVIRADQPEVAGGIKGHHSEGELELPEAQSFISHGLVNEGLPVPGSLDKLKADAWEATLHFFATRKVFTE